MEQRLIEGDTVVISLIPYTYHATVIKSAIRKKRNVVTLVYPIDYFRQWLMTDLGRVMFHQQCSSWRKVNSPNFLSRKLHVRSNG